MQPIAVRDMLATRLLELVDLAVQVVGRNLLRFGVLVECTIEQVHFIIKNKIR